MADDPAAAPPALHPAANWSDPTHVRGYRDRLERNPNERRDQLRLMAHLIPFATETELRVLDLGAGFGVAAAAVLDAFPRATAVLVEMSPPMIEAGAEWLASYAGRYRYVKSDFIDGRLPEEVGEHFHAAVSSVALQYVPAAGKAQLFQEVAERLVPGGCLLNLSLIGAPDEVLQQLYTQVGESERAARGDPPWRGEPGGRRWQPQSLDEHLELLRAAGLVHVDCFWKQLGMALMGGFRPAIA